MYDKFFSYTSPNVSIHLYLFYGILLVPLSSFPSRSHLIFVFQFLFVFLRIAKFPDVSTTPPGLSLPCLYRRPKDHRFPFFLSLVKFLSETGVYNIIPSVNESSGRTGRSPRVLFKGDTPLSLIMSRTPGVLIGFGPCRRVRTLGS